MAISVLTAEVCLDLISRISYCATEEGIDSKWAMARQAVEELREHIKEQNAIMDASVGAAGRSDNSDVVP